MKNNNKKVGITLKNWILSILGIIILSTFVILPPVFRLVFKDKPIEKPNKVYPMLTTTCVKNNINSSDNTNSITVTLNYRNSQLKNYSKVTEKVYEEPSDYEKFKKDYGRLVTSSKIIDGFDYKLDLNDDDSILLITEDYNLGTFVTTAVVLPGDSKSTPIESEYVFDQSITVIKQKLTTNGYVCSDYE